MTADQHARLEAARRIAEHFSVSLTDEERDHLRRSDEWLYDEDGLPR